MNESAESTPLRVLMLAQYPYEDSDHAKGGVMQAAYQLVQGFIERDFPGLDLRVLSLNEGCATPREVRHGSVTVLHLPKSTTRWGFIFSEPWRLLYRFMRMRRDFRPHVVHGQGNVSFIMLSLMSGRRSVQTIHGVFRNEQKTIPREQLTFSTRVRFFLRETLETFYLRAARTVIATSNQIVTLARSAGGSPKHIVWINNSVDGGFLAEPAAAPGRGEGLTLLFVGIITPRKGLHFLLAAFRELTARHPGARLRVVGPTDVAREYAQGLMREYSALIDSQHLHFTGAIDQSALLREYRQADVFVLPSLGETAPVAISQAMAIGLPVIATRVGGIPDMVVEQATGLVVPPADAAALGAAVDRLLSDRDLMSSMGREARRIGVERYSPSVNAEKMYRVYRGCAAGEAPSP